jgi:hypothetical protein
MFTQYVQGLLELRSVDRPVFNGNKEQNNANLPSQQYETQRSNQNEQGARDKWTSWRKGYFIGDWISLIDVIVLQ